MIQKLYTGLLKAGLHLMQCSGIAANRTIEGFHTAHGSYRNLSFFGKVNLLPPYQGSRGTKLSPSGKAQVLKVTNRWLHVVTLSLYIITNSVKIGATDPRSASHNKEVAMATSKTIQAQVPEPNKKSVMIPAPKFENAVFHIGGPVLVIHRFSAKTKNEMKMKMEAGKTASSKKNREPKDTDQTYNEARYVSKEGWDGFHAGAIRNAMISACRLVNFKMTLAKLSLFVEADGYDAQEPQIPLVRIYGKPQKQEDMARVETGAPYVTVRAAYHNWKAQVRVRWDNDQFTLTDVTNLINRVGAQVGLCEGRYDSPNSCGMGWGSFEIERTNSAHGKAA